MSIETQLKNLNDSIKDLTEVLKNPASAAIRASAPIPEASQQASKTTPATQDTTPQVTNGMPPAPDFTQPQNQQQPSTYKLEAPFTDAAGLTDYITKKWGELGQEKGSQIFTVIQQLGHQNLTAIRPDQYEEFFKKVEAIQ